MRQTEERREDRSAKVESSENALRRERERERETEKGRREESFFSSDEFAANYDGI